MMNKENDILLEISKIKNLPPLPESSIRIISAVNDPDIPVDALVDVLALSPVLVARLLGLANSAFFARAGEIVDLRIAIIQVLGLNLVKSMALSIVLNVELKTNSCEMFDANFFWSHSLVTAYIAQKIAQQIKDPLILPNIAYTSGLLLNIGLIAAIHVFPETLNAIFAKKVQTNGGVANELFFLLGKNQYDIGSILLERWQLPEVYQTITAQFRKSDFNGEEKGFVKMIELSHWAAIFVVEDKMDELPDFSDLLNEVSFSTDMLSKIMDDIYSSKDGILELAAIIGE